MSVYKIITDASGKIVSVQEEGGWGWRCFGILFVVVLIGLLSRLLLEFLMTYQLWVYLSLAITIALRLIWDNGIVSTLLSLSTLISSMMWYGVFIEARFGYVQTDQIDKDGLFQMITLILSIPISLIVGLIIFKALIYAIDRMKKQFTNLKITNKNNNNNLKNKF